MNACCRLVCPVAVMALALTLPAVARAGALEVSPILIDIAATGGSAGVITLRNRGTTPTNVQVRVQRWQQVNGADVLERDDGVVASPPFATLSTNNDYVLRIVRTDQRAIVGEESYRLLIDEFPAPRQPDGTVALAIRYSIPVFFHAPGARDADVEWSATRSGDTLCLRAVNHGERRLRVSNLRLVDGSGKSVPFGSGLAGYALGGAGRNWTIGNAATAFTLKDAHVVFDSETGPRTAEIHTQITSPPGRARAESLTRAWPSHAVRVAGAWQWRSLRRVRSAMNQPGRRSWQRHDPRRCCWKFS